MYVSPRVLELHLAVAHLSYIIPSPPHFFRPVSSPSCSGLHLSLSLFLGKNTQHTKTPILLFKKTGLGLAFHHAICITLFFPLFLSLCSLYASLRCVSAPLSLSLTFLLLLARIYISVVPCLFSLSHQSLSLLFSLVLVLSSPPPLPFSDSRVQRIFCGIPCHGFRGYSGRCQAKVLVKVFQTRAHI